jgi:CheY-like chemotaxis protein
VLVVEDNRDAAASLAALLSEQGHQVDVAGDGQAAIQRVRAQRPDVVLMDIGLPGLDGYEVARRLREQEGLTDALLVAVSGYGQLRDRLRSREAGFDDHLLKPIDYERLAPLLARCKPRPARGAAEQPGDRPPAPPPEGAGRPPASSAAATRTDKPSYRVLLIDDSEPVAQVSREVLQAEGHEVIVAHDGPAAVRIAKAERPQVVLCDISLAGEMDGFAVAEALRREPGLSDAVLIAVTGHADPALQQRSLQAGFDLHLVKPVDFTRLAEIVSSISRCAS